MKQANLDSPVTEPPSDTSSSPDRLPRSLGVLPLAIIFIAFNAPLAVLAGFLQPAIAFGNGIGAPVAFLVAGALLLLFQVGSLAMSRHMKSPGAFYCYITEGIGKPAGLAGSFLAAIAYILFSVNGFAFLGLITETLMKQLFGSSPVSWQIWGLVGFAIVTVLNLLRVDLSAKAIGIFVGFEVVIVAVYQAVVMIQGGPEGYSGASFLPAQFLSGNPGLAVLFAINTMIGIEAMAVFREEARAPEKTVPRAAYGAITFTTLFFALAAWAYIVAIGPSHVVDDARNAPVQSVIDSMGTYLGGFVSTLVAVLLVTSQLAASNAVQGSSVRYLYTLGRDRVLPARLGSVHPKLGSPYIAVIASVGTSLVLYLIMLTITSDAVLIYSILGGFGTICLMPVLLGTSASVILFFRKHPGIENAWKALIAPALAFIGLAGVLTLVMTHLDMMVGNKTIGVLCAVGLLVIIAIGVALGFWFKSQRPETYRRIGRQAP